MGERSLRIGSVRCTFAAEGTAGAAIDSWLGRAGGERSDRDDLRGNLDLAFELVDSAAPPPLGEHVRSLGGGEVWRSNDTIDLRTPDSDGGRIDLARGHALVWIGDQGDARLAIHRCVRPLLFLGLGRRGWHGLHAAAVLVDGEAVVLLGNSGAGKSTMSIRLAASGHSLVADDMVFVDEQTLCVVGLPEPPRLDALHAADLGLAGRPHVAGKITVDVPNRARGPAPIALLALLDPTPADAGMPAITEAHAGDAMTALLRAGLLTIDPAQDSDRLGALARLASTHTAVRLSRDIDPARIRTTGDRFAWASTAPAT